MYWQQKFAQAIVISLIALTLLLGVGTQGALAADTVQGKQIFQVHCAGCHPQGGNIIRRGKNLKQRALRRNGIDSLEAIISLVENGKNNMSGYKDRLSASEIEIVSAYVLKQASTGWRS